MAIMALVECDYTKLSNVQFTLYISNQSFIIDPVDIQVEMDGIIVVNDKFYVEDQHTFIPSELSLRQGMHQIRIWSVKGNAELSTEFELIDQDMAMITYWHSPNSIFDPTTPGFEFVTGRGPLLID